MKKRLLFVLFLSITTVAFCQTLHLAKPNDTDPDIDLANENHWIYINGDVAPKNKLYVFLPGTFAFPALYTRVLKTAANLTGK